MLKIIEYPINMFRNATSERKVLQALAIKLNI